MKLCSEIKDNRRPHNLNGHDGLLPHITETENEQTAEHDEI
jgi:hypothetical protein